MSITENGHLTLTPMELIDQAANELAKAQRKSKQAMEARKRAQSEEKAAQEKYDAMTVDPALRAYGQAQLKIAQAR